MRFKKNFQEFGPNGPASPPKQGVIPRIEPADAGFRLILKALCDRSMQLECLSGVAHGWIQYLLRYWRDRGRGCGSKIYWRVLTASVGLLTAIRDDSRAFGI